MPRLANCASMVQLAEKAEWVNLVYARIPLVELKARGKSTYKGHSQVRSVA